MRHGSLFSGIGGFDLAASWCGWENVFSVEKDAFCRKVLKKNFPEVTQHEDIFDFDGKKYKGKIDIITGGFPCQPFSVAGKRKGKEDDRHLWAEMLRIITEVRPRWVVAENVTGIVTMALDDTIASLESEGYAAAPIIIPACAVGAPHRRDRVWIIFADTEQFGNRRWVYEGDKIIPGTYPLKGSDQPPEQSSTNSSIENDGRNRREQEERQIPESGKGIIESDATDSSNQGSCATEKNGARKGRHIAENIVDAADSGSKGLQGSERPRSLRGGQEIAHGATTERDRDTGWAEHWLEVATRLCRVDARVSNRVDRLKSLGNAIVPQVAYEIFRMIDIIECGQ